VGGGEILQFKLYLHDKDMLNVYFEFVNRVCNYIMFAPSYFQKYHSDISEPNLIKKKYGLDIPSVLIFNQFTGVLRYKKSGCYFYNYIFIFPKSYKIVCSWLVNVLKGEVI
jgi:hypothetical protein